MRVYEAFYNDTRQANRQRVLAAAKELDKLMKSATKKAEARVGGFASASLSSRRVAAGHGANLTEINDNLRLLVDAVRRLVEANSLAVRIPFFYEMHA